MLISVLLGFVVGVIASCFWSKSPESLLKEARTAESVGKLELALELADRALQRDSRSVEGLLFAGSIASKLDDPVLELKYFRQLPLSASGAEIADRLKDAGEHALKRGRASDAEFLYRRVLTLLPDDLMIHRRLGTLFLGEGRRWEAAPHLYELVKGKSFTLEELAYLGSRDEIYEAEKLISFFEESAPNDYLPLMGRARLKMFQLSMTQAEGIIQQILQQQEDLIEAHAQLGVILVTEARMEELERWRRQLPRAAYEHPETWWVLGKQARQNGDTKAAIRCAWETLRREPNHLGATYQLGQLLFSEGRNDDARVMIERAAKLEILSSTIHELLFHSPTSEKMLRCAQVCEEIGRHWEAWAWHTMVETHHPSEAIPAEGARLLAQLTPQMPQTLPAQNFSLRFDFSTYPVPKTMLFATQNHLGDERTPPDVRFEDVSASAGLDFRYENGTKRGVRGFMIYQSIGGGVASLDFDGDGAPDLFFPQASQLAPKLAGIDATDRLYRNVGGQCVDVTESALPPDSGYGFGVAVGDFDADGFPDLYVANAGRNRLLRNNGDGVFQDVTETSGIQGGEWTTSCLMADINGDGLPDLFDVNYCGGERPFEQVCIHKTLKARTSCSPNEFAAAEDDLLINLGDGRFENVSQAAGIREFDGRGLGIVAANFDDQPGLDLYIANDMSANVLFLNRTNAPGTVPTFDEQGALTGTAFDSDRRTPASMGIAVEDVDGDELIDLFVTNSCNESNTLYHHQIGHFFIDATRQFQLRTPSLSMYGFGTQFMDADRDGRPDLIVVNGHVDDYTEIGIPFRMRHQFFSNRGDRFVEVPASKLGAFFAKSQLGRGLARLDWNRDGRDDFAVSQLIDPAALVLNRSTNEGHFVSIRLVGQKYRDAIGSEVRVTSDHQTFVKQLIAGDGFECSNERRLLFGLGETSSIGEIRVRWPGGAEERFTNAVVDCDLLLVEGTQVATTISREHSE